MDDRNQTFEEFNRLYPKIVGANIRRYLKEYDISQTELAKRIGVSQQTVSYWCNGLKTPRQANIDDMCVLFHCNRSDLMQEYKVEIPKKPGAPLTVDYIATDKKKLDTADIMIEVQKMDGSNVDALLKYARFLNSLKDSSKDGD